MAEATGTFNATGTSNSVKLDAKGRGRVQIISGSFVGKIDVQAFNGAAWGNTGDALTDDGVLYIQDLPYVQYRLNCSVYTSGSATYSLVGNG